MKLDFLASEPHYVDHLWPIWEALDPEERGQFHAGRFARRYLQRKGVAPRGHVVDRSNAPVIVAGYTDLQSNRGRPVVLVEHGAGQHYGGLVYGGGSYAGGPDREAVALFLVPNAEAAARNAKVYPRARVEVVGCPKLDEWHSDISTNNIPANVTPTVAVSFHWDCRAVPEARSAYHHFHKALEELSRRYKVIGHGHPRYWHFLARRYAEKRLEAVAHFADVLERADVYVCDNSSTLYEFASTGRPVALMDAPWYRPDVHHGGRFWTHADMGPRTGDPRALVDTVALALEDPAPFPDNRRRAVDAAYAYCDGKATERAVEAIRETFDSGR